MGMILVQKRDGREAVESRVGEAGADLESDQQRRGLTARASHRRN